MRREDVFMAAIACFGALHSDVTSRVEGEVRLGTSNPVRVSRAPGGVAANIARALARLGDEVLLCGAVGDDAAGEALLEAVDGAGVDVTGVERLRGATATYTAVIDGTGSLVVGLADMALYESLDGAWAERAVRRARDHEVWLLDANPTASAISTVATAAGDRILAGDPVSVAKASRFLPVIDRFSVVFPDRGEMVALLGRVAEPADGAAALHGLGPDVVVSLGAEGLVVADSEGVHPRPAMAVGPVVDVTGAGDCLAAGYLHARAAGLADPVAWGLATAAIAITAEGAVPDALTLDAVRELVG